MKKVFLKKRSVSQAKLIPGIVGLTTLALLNVSEPADAASITCGPGDHWVDTCPSGSYEFSNFVTINLNFGINPNNQPDFTATISGTTSVFVGNPIDAIIDDPLLGDVGKIDGHLDVIRTEIFNNTSIGSTPFSPRIVGTIGDGVPDLAPTPLDATLPYQSLYSAGAILERPNNAALADSFFNIFLEVQGTPEGSLRNRDPLTLKGVVPLIEFPLREPQNYVDYVSTDTTSLFTAGADGIFWTGDESEFARFVPDDSGSSVVFRVTPIPEPSTGLSVVLCGLAMMFGLARKKLSRHKGHDES